MLREVDNNIWVAEQTQRYLGLSVGTRMTVVRLENGELIVISPIKINDDMAVQLAKLGTVRHIVAPNLYHYLFATELKARYPTATFWAAPGLKEKKPELPIDQVLSWGEKSPWPEIAALFFAGFKTLGLNGFDAFNECVFFHRASRTLIVTDAAFHFDERSPKLTQFAMRLTGSYKSLSPSLLERIATTDKDIVRNSVEKILEWDFERVIMAYGSIIKKNGKERFKQGYCQFLGLSEGAMG